MGQTLFCSCLQHPEFLTLAAYFDVIVDNLRAIPFHLWTKKSIIWRGSLSSDKSLLSSWYRRICLTFWKRIVSLIIINLNFWRQEHSLWLLLIKFSSNSTGRYSLVLLGLFSSVWYAKNSACEKSSYIMYSPLQNVALGLSA